MAALEPVSVLGAVLAPVMLLPVLDATAPLQLLVLAVLLLMLVLLLVPVLLMAVVAVVEAVLDTVPVVPSAWMRTRGAWGTHNTSRNHNEQRGTERDMATTQQTHIK